MRNNVDVASVEPEYWVMRPTLCLYCGEMANWDEDDSSFHEDMGVDSHTHGWIYCSNCSALHAKNKRKYLSNHGYLTANQLFRDHPRLQELDSMSRVGVRVATPFKHCVVYTVEKKGWTIAKSYPYKYPCFIRNGIVWVRLVNATIGSYACSNLSEILRANKIEYDTVKSLKRATLRGLKGAVFDRAQQSILDMVYSDRKDDYFVSVRR